MLKKSKELVRLRETCCLGLSSTILMPQILHDLHEIVSSDRMHFAWTDKLGNIINGYFEKPVPSALDYFKNNQQRFYDEAGLSFRQALLFGKTVGNFRWPFRPGFELTESHERLFAALGVEHSLDGVIRDSDGPLGLIFLMRRKGDPDFSLEDEQYLAQCLPYIGHAISHAEKTPSNFVEVGNEALMVFDSHGCLKYQSAVAKDLCIYALADPVNECWEQEIGLEDMQRSLQNVFFKTKISLEQARSTDPPSWTISNRWGEFQLRAYLLDESPGAPPSFGIILKKKVPIEVLLLQKITNLPLSNKQREVCYLIAQGVETVQIALLLGITKTTLKEHVQTILRRLGLRTRAELLRRLYE